MSRRAAVLGFVAILAAAASAAQAAPQCFRAQDWRGSRALNAREIYIRVGNRDIWKLQFKDDCPGARVPGDVTIGNLVSGATQDICSPVDLQITVAPRGGSNPTACIVERMSKLSPGEVAALPRGALP